MSVKQRQQTNLLNFDFLLFFSETLQTGEELRPTSSQCRFLSDCLFSNKIIVSQLELSCSLILNLLNKDKLRSSKLVHPFFLEKRTNTARYRDTYILQIRIEIEIQFLSACMLYETWRSAKFPIF